MTTLGTALIPTYDQDLVVLSIVIAVIASYAALDLAGRGMAARGHSRTLWLMGSGGAMGTGIWSMHFIGMLAYNLPIPVTYDFPTVLASLAIAIAASTAALLVLSRRVTSMPLLLAGGTLMGLGIAAMHYAGMAAMRLQAITHYDRGLAGASVMIAIAVSLAALWLAFHLRVGPTPIVNWRQIGSALIMGAAIPSMHYTAMAAVTFTPADLHLTARSFAVDIVSLAAAGITIAMLLILGLAVLTSLIDRRAAALAAELEASLIGYRSLFEQHPVAIFSCDLDGNFIKPNPVCEKIFGHPLEDLRRTSFLRFVTDKDLQRVKEHFKRAAEGVPQNYDLALARKDGQGIDLNMTNIPIGMRDNTVVFGIATDITMQKQAERALRRAHDECELQVHARTAELAKVNEDLRAQIRDRRLAEEALQDKNTQLAAITDAMAAFLETGDWRKASALLLRAALSQTSSECGFVCVVMEGRTLRVLAHEGIDWSVVLGPERYDKALRAEQEIGYLEFPDAHSLFGSVITRRTPVVSNYAGADRRSGDPPPGQIPLRGFLGVPISKGPEVVGMIAVANRPDGYTDADQLKLEILSQAVGVLYDSYRRREREAALETERKQAEEKIHEQAALLDVADDAILVGDLDGTILFWNKGAQRLYRWAEDAAIGKKAADLLYKSPPGELEAARRMLLEKGEWRGEMQQATKDGKDILVESHWTLVRGKDGQPKSILMVNNDITEKRLLEQQFLRGQRLESLGTLAGGIAHDLNNVLTPILMAAQLLRLKLKDSTSREWLDAVEASTRRGVDMVKQVLAFTRGLEGERAVIQVKPLLSDIEKMAKDTFPRNIQLLTKCTAARGTVLGDATQLYQVLMNLCVNARDAMPGGGRLQIEAEDLVLDEHGARIQMDAKPGPYVLLSVTDTGTGIPPDVIDKIFDPFFTTKEPGKGTGLGLSTVLGIVKHHGGFVTVHSELGNGTQFRVYLPANEAAETTRAAAELPGMPLGHGELVLVVDDEAAIRDMSQAALETHGYRVLTAKDGTEAVTLYAQRKEVISVVVTDMLMPVMDGAATIQALRRIDPDVKLIAVSGLVESDRVGHVAGAGSIPFLRKPYSTEVLLTTLHHVLRGAPHPAPDPLPRPAGKRAARAKASRRRPAG